MSFIKYINTSSRGIFFYTYKIGRGGEIFFFCKWAVREISLGIPVLN